MRSQRCASFTPPEDKDNTFHHVTLRLLTRALPHTAVFSQEQSEGIRTSSRFKARICYTTDLARSLSVAV